MAPINFSGVDTVRYLPDRHGCLAANGQWLYYRRNDYSGDFCPSGDTFLARFFLDGTLIVDPDGVSFTKLGKKHYYKWKDISYIFSAPIAGIYPFYNTIHFHKYKLGIREGVTLPEYYGFISGIGLGNFLKAYHKAALEAQGSGKQE